MTLARASVAKTIARRGRVAAARREPSGAPPMAHGIVQLQRAAGNQAVEGLIQTKLSVNAPGDKFEREADSVADKVMRMRAPGAADPVEKEPGQAPIQTLSVQREVVGPEPPAQAKASDEPADQHAQRTAAEPDKDAPVQRMGEQPDVDPPAQRSPAEEPQRPVQRAAAPDAESTVQRAAEPEAEAPVQRAADPDEGTVQRQDAEPPVQAKRNDGPPAADLTAVESSLRATRGSGQALQPEVRSDVEARFRRDFSQVRVHTDAGAAQLSRGLNAQAFTQGANIYFDAGKYSPSAPSGMRLLAHELTHVVQQGQAPEARAVGGAGASSALLSGAVQRKGYASTAKGPPTEAERKAALAAARKAEADATRAAGRSQAGITKARAAVIPEQSAGKTSHARAQETAEATAAKAKAAEAVASEDVEAAAAAGSGTSPGAATGGDAAAAGTGAAATEASDKAPASAEADSAFQAVLGNVKTVGKQQRSHAPAKAKAGEAQAAAKSPPAELKGKAQSTQVGEMQQAETPAFNAVKFKADLIAKIKALAPKNANDADEFKKQNKLSGVKKEMQGQVATERDASQAPLEAKTKAAPDTGRVEPKPVTALPPTPAGAAPADVGAAQAAPKAKGASEVEAPLAAGSQSLDAQMADADVSDDQLSRGNEPEFQSALGAKQEAKADAAAAPDTYRQFEQTRLSDAEAAAAKTATDRTQKMHSERGSLFGKVVGDQGKATTNDEKERAAVGARIDSIYGGAKTKVEGILKGLDEKVATTFDQGAAAAKAAFEDYVNAKMDAWKEERYGGLLGWAQWLDDKWSGLPKEVDQFYADGRDRFLQQMDGVIDTVVAIIGRGLADAKAAIAQGKQDIQTYVDGLAPNLKEVGQKAAADIQGKFDELTQSVDAKQNDLIDTLAGKYQENLQAVDARITEMKAANQGLLDKAKGALLGVIETILKLKDMLLTVLAKIADTVSKIIKDPIGFLSNLVTGLAQGFQNFGTNILTHLKTGLITWLTGTLGPAGITLPEDIFSLQGIISLVAQILGISWDMIRAKAVKLLGEPMVKALEGGFKVFQILRKDGLAGVWEFIKEELADLKEAVLGQIQDLVITQVIQAGIKWVMSLLTPASAFVKAAMAIYDIVMFFVNKAGQILELVNSVVDAVAAIANGAVGGAAKLVENALAKALPIVIGFLASLLGIGDLSSKIQAVIQKIRARIDGAIDKVIAKAKEVGKGLMGKKGGKDGREVGGAPGAADGAALVRFDEKVPFESVDGKHDIWIEMVGGSPEIEVASKKRSIHDVFGELDAKLKHEKLPEDEEQQAIMKMVGTASQDAKDIEESVKSIVNDIEAERKAGRETSDTKTQSARKDVLGRLSGLTNVMQTANKWIASKGQQGIGLPSKRNVANVQYHLTLGQSDTDKSQDPKRISGSLTVRSGPENTPNPFFEATEIAGLSGPKYLRTPDSEYKALEHIAHLITSEIGEIKNATGLVSLHSKFKVCDSCKKVIEQFRTKFPNVEVDVVGGQEEE